MASKQENIQYVKLLILLCFKIILLACEQISEYWYSKIQLPFNRNVNFKKIFLEMILLNLQFITFLRILDIFVKVQLLGNLNQIRDFFTSLKLNPFSKILRKGTFYFYKKKNNKETFKGYADYLKLLYFRLYFEVRDGFKKRRENQPLPATLLPLG